jgi:multiple sugar transport system ATP-binding protein
MADIRLNHVGKVFDSEVIAVDDVSIDVGDGEFLVLVGPSGCGKSTIMRLVAGLEEVTNGEIWIGDRNVTDLPPKDRDISMVFQNYALYPHMTVAQNIGFGLRLRHADKKAIDVKVREVAHQLGLAPLLERKPGQLSGGQRQRVAMGRAMVREPLAYLMDEPLSNLDAKLRVQMRGELARRHADLRTTTLYVTHDQVEAMTLGDRVAVLKDGALQQLDTPQRLFTHPVNVFVAAFIGSPAMNLLQAQVSRDDSGHVLQLGSWRLRVGTWPQLDPFVGGRVDVGIRPSDFSLVERDGGNATDALDVVADVVEDLGTEVNVLFTLDAGAVDTADTRAATGVVGEAEELPHAAAEGTVMTASLGSRTQLRPGERVLLGVDTRRLHFFDPATGHTLLDA